MLLRVSAAAAAGILFVTGMSLHDLEAVAIALLLVGGSLLLRVRGGTLGRVALALVFIDVVFWMAPAAWSNATHASALSTLVVPLALVACCLAGLAGVAQLPDIPVAVGTVALVVIALVAAGVAGTNDRVPAAGARVAVISSKGAKFSTSKLILTGPTVSVVFHNKDLFWHTFTIDQLDVNIKAPLGGKRVERFTAPPGAYKFYCAIPGHEAAGMKGTLTVTNRPL